MTEAIVVRQALDSDAPFIFSSWLKSFRSSDFAKHLSNSMYYREHHKLIADILERSQVICAVSDEDESQIFGWICAETGGPVPVVHYVYVKQTYRRVGIASKLLSLVADGAFLYTHDTGAAPELAKNGVYSPYFAFMKGIA